MATIKKPAPAAAMLEIGSSGLRRWAGFIREEFLRELQGPRGMQVYREMRDNSDVVGACMGAIELLIRQVKWWVQPFSQDAEDVMRAQFVDECRGDLSISWQETITEQLSMLTYGFAPCEIVYKRRLGENPAGPSRYNDGRIGWRKLPLRAQDTVVQWDFDMNGGVQGFFQQAPPLFRRVYIPIEKTLLFKPRSEKGNPEGRSVLRNAYFSWYFAKKIAEIEGIGIARDLTGVPVGWIPADCFDAEASPAHKATLEAMKKIVTSLERDEQEGIVIPLDYYPGTTNKRYDLTLLSTGGRRQFDTTAICQRYDRKIAHTMLHDIILMGEPNTIQYKGKSIPNLFATALGGWLDMVTEVYNTHGIPRLVKLNGWPPDRAPVLKHGPVEVQDLGILGAFMAQLADKFGWDLDSNIDQHLRRAADLPEADPKAIRRREPAAAPEPSGGNAGQGDEE